MDFGSLFLERAYLGPILCLAGLLLGWIALPGLKTDSLKAVYRYEYDVRSVVLPSKNIIFLVVILIFNHVLFRLMQKYLSSVTNCFLCCMNWYSWGVICRPHRIRTRSHRIRIVVKVYNHTLRLRYGCIPMRYYPQLVLF